METAEREVAAGMTVEVATVLGELDALAERLEKMVGKAKA